MKSKIPLRKRLAKARLLGQVVKNSLEFKLRRRRPFKKRFFSDNILTVIVDMDGTVFESDAGMEALSIVYPEKLENGTTLGEHFYKSIIKGIADGNFSVEEAIIQGNNLLAQRNCSKKDFKKVLEVVKVGLRTKLIKALKKIKETHKAKIILATLSSVDFALMLNNFLKKNFEFEFDGLIGSELKFNSSGVIIGLNSIIGTQNTEIQGIPVKSKIQAIQDLCQERDWIFSPKNSLLITDSYGDIDLAKKMKTILIKTNKGPSIVQKISQLLKLADYIFEVNTDLDKKIESVFKTH